MLGLSELVKVKASVSILYICGSVRDGVNLVQCMVQFGCQRYAKLLLIDKRANLWIEVQPDLRGRFIVFLVTKRLYKVLRIC